MNKRMAGFFTAVILCIAVTVTAGEFTGRVIYIKDNLIEVKKKSREMTFNLTAETAVTRKGEKAEQQDIAVCQVVRVTYKGKGKHRTATGIDIVRESDCLPSDTDQSTPKP